MVEWSKATDCNSVQSWVRIPPHALNTYSMKHKILIDNNDLKVGMRVKTYKYLDNNSQRKTWFKGVVKRVKYKNGKVAMAVVLLRSTNSSWFNGRSLYFFDIGTYFFYKVKK